MFEGHSRVSVTSRMRLRTYDYSTPAIYYVTICTEQRLCLFGEIENHELFPSTAGLMVESWWHSIPGEFPGVMLDQVVVMPNHLHGLIVLGGETTSGAEPSDASLSTVVGWFKSRTTHDYTIGVNHVGWKPFPGRLWRLGFYDHIVRSDAALKRIRKYISNNPANWHTDENFRVR